MTYLRLALIVLKAIAETVASDRWRIPAWVETDEQLFTYMRFKREQMKTNADAFLARIKE